MDGNGSQSSTEDSRQLADVSASATDFDCSTSLKANSVDSGEVLGEEGDEDASRSSDGSEQDHPDEVSNDEADDGQLCTLSPPEGTVDDGDVSNCSADGHPNESASGDNDSNSFCSIDDNVIDLDNNELNYDEEEAGEEQQDERDVQTSPNLPNRQASLDCEGANQVSDSDENGDDVGIGFLPQQNQQRIADELQGEAISSSEGEEYGGDGEEGNERDGQRVDDDGEEEGELTEEEETMQTGAGDRSEEAEQQAGEELEEEKAEELEEGELRSDEDSDDGVPEIRGGLSPPGLPLLASLAPPSIGKIPIQQQLLQHLQPHFHQPLQLPLFSNAPPVSSVQPPPPLPFRLVDDRSTNQSRELCRFFLKGFCVNGDACRFKHSRTDAGGIRFPSFDSMRKLPTAVLFNRHIIPPPTGPPIPLLSTEFAPPPSLLAGGTARAAAPIHSVIISDRSGVTPAVASAQPSAESAAWERGLRQARAMVRRQQQKSESDDKLSATEGEGDEAVDGEQRERKVEDEEHPMAASGIANEGTEEGLQPISPIPAKLSSGESDANEATFFDGHHGEEPRNRPSFVPAPIVVPSSSVGQSRRPIASRVVVEASYSVGVSRHRSSLASPPASDQQPKLFNRVVRPQKQPFGGIPSIIDAIRGKPILEPPPSSTISSSGVAVTTFVQNSRRPTTSGKGEVNERQQHQRDQRRVLTTGVANGSAAAYSDPWARNSSSAAQTREQRGRTAQRRRGTRSPHSSVSSTDDIHSHNLSNNSIAAKPPLRRRRSRSSSVSAANPRQRRTSNEQRSRRWATTTVHNRGQRETAKGGKRSATGSIDGGGSFAVDGKEVEDCRRHQQQRSRHNRQSPSDKSSSRSSSRRKSPSDHHNNRRRQWHNRRSSPSSLGALLNTSTDPWITEKSGRHKGPRTPPEPSQQRRRRHGENDGNAGRSPSTPPGRSSASRSTISSDLDEEANNSGRKAKKSTTYMDNTSTATTAVLVQHRSGDGVSVSSSMSHAPANRQLPVIGASTKKSGNRRMSNASSAAVLFGVKNMEDDEDDSAPAAYRLKPMDKEGGGGKGQKRARSVSSSSSSSSSSTSDSSSSSGSSVSSSSSSLTSVNAATKTRAKKVKSTPNMEKPLNAMTTVAKDNMDKDNSSTTICSSEDHATQSKGTKEIGSGGSTGIKVKCHQKNGTAFGPRGEETGDGTVQCDDNVIGLTKPADGSFVKIEDNGQKMSTTNIAEAKDGRATANSSSGGADGPSLSSTEQNKKRREQLRKRLQSVEEAIARKRQHKETTTTN